MTVDINSSEYQLGQQGEGIIEKFFRQLGRQVLQTHEHQGGAAMLLRKADKLIQPDRLMTGRATPWVWVEIKTKSHPAHMHKPHSSFRHGFEESKWHNYLEVACSTKTPLFIAFFVWHEEEGGPLRPHILLGSAEQLENNAIFQPGGKHKTPFVYWDIHSTPFWKFPINAGTPIATPLHRPTFTWDLPAKDGTLPMERELSKRQEHQRQRREQERINPRLF